VAVLVGTGRELDIDRRDGMASSAFEGIVVGSETVNRGSG